VKSPPIEVVPETDKLVTFVIALLNTPAPVMVKPLLPPVIPFVVIVVPVKVRSPPLNVTAPV